MPGITNPAEAYFKDGAWGWDGSVWRKLPLLYGYSDRWVDVAIGVASGGGDAGATCTAVAEGYVYVLQAMAVSHDAGANKVLRVDAVGGADYIILVYEASAVTGQVYYWSGGITMKKDDYVRAILFAPGDGKGVVIRLWGYKMSIAE